MRLAAGCGHPATQVQRRWCAATGRCGHRPLRGDGEVPAATRANGAQRSVCASGWEGWVEIAAEIIPKGTINAGQSLSQPVADSSLYTREPLGTGDADRRVGPAGLLAMTMDFCHSEERSDVGICPFYDGRWTGGRAAEVVGPYGKSTEVPAAGRCGHRPLRNEVGSRRDLPGSA